MVDTVLLLRFRAVASALSFRRAAQMLGVDQPGLSRQIRRLERELGFQLLTRNTRNVALTPEGEAVASLAADLEQAVVRAETAVNRLRREHDTVIRLGAHPAFYWWDGVRRLRQHFAQVAPAARIEMVSGLGARHLERLRGGALDAALMLSPPAEAGLDILRVLTVRPNLLLPEEHPLARRDELQLADLDGLQVAIAAPGRDRSDFDRLFGAFIAAGADAVMVAEGPTAVAHYAATDRLAMISIRDAGLAPPPGFVRLEVSGIAPESLALVRRARDRGLLNRFWSAACRLFDPDRPPGLSA